MSNAILNNIDSICGGNVWLAETLKRAITSTEGTAYERFIAAERTIVAQLDESSPAKERLQAHKVLAVINACQIKLLEVQLGEDLDGDGHIGRQFVKE